ncbi:MAG: TetR/AcrR family transcriptional regulator C-terminal domain-containing protein [Kibdelosporangium sp.]
MDGGAPYLKIVAVIRDRITRGELRPGDRIPSTRGITQEFGVAMATATKVIAALRDEGLVDARPGAGTVVKAWQPAVTARKSPREQELNRERVVRAAIAIADSEGLATLSMRRVATELGAATMSLYRHVSSKDDLVVLMADTVFGDMLTFPADRPADWRESLRIAARLMWAACNRHPWAAEVLSMSRPQVMPNAIVVSEWTLGVLRDLGFGVDDMMNIHLNLFGHVRGLAITLQAELQARQDTGMDNEEWLETQESGLTGMIQGGPYPTMQWVVTQEFDYDLDRLFEYGLQLLLDGVERQLRHLAQGPARQPGGRHTQCGQDR